MHFSTLVLAALPALVHGLTLYSDFNCAEGNTTTFVVDCIPGSCTPFAGFHSFQNTEGVLPLHVRTFENGDCTSPRAPVDFVALPGQCNHVITGHPVESYRCSPSPF